MAGGVRMSSPALPTAAAHKQHRVSAASLALPAWFLTRCLPPHPFHRSYCADLNAGAFSVHHGTIQKRSGSGPNEPGSFQLVGHMQLPAGTPSR